MIKNDVYTKLAKIMCWDVPSHMTAIEVFAIKCNNTALVPHRDIVDVVATGGLERWAMEQMHVKSEAELCKMIESVCMKTIVSPPLIAKPTQKVFPPIFNFYTYVNNLQKNGKFSKECEGIASVVWNGALARKQLAARCAKMFDVEQSDDIFNTTVKKMKATWALSDRDIDALRYFVCQCKTDDLNPSLNKTLYLFGEKKQTGKTTLARAFSTVLNADKFNNFGKYESTYSKEMGYNDHDLPLACIHNCIVLDEAMPKDSRKSYGALKAVFSSNSFNYNPKFRQVINIPAKRNYICTSNEDIADFVQDRFERRFYAIEFAAKPKKLSFDDIYETIKTFCIHATPRCNWQEWYDSFEFVSGAAEREKNEVLQEIINSISFFDNRQTCTVKQIANHLFKNEPTREQKKAVEIAIAELADDCRYKSNCYLFDSHKIAATIREREGLEPLDDSTDDLPF